MHQAACYVGSSLQFCQGLKTLAFKFAFSIRSQPQLILFCGIYKVSEEGDPETWWPQGATLTNHAISPLRFRFSIPETLFVETQPSRTNVPKKEKKNNNDGLLHLPYPTPQPAATICWPLLLFTNSSRSNSATDGTQLVSIFATEGNGTSAGLHFKSSCSPSQATLAYLRLATQLAS